MHYDLRQRLEQPFQRGGCSALMLAQSSRYTADRRAGPERPKYDPATDRRLKGWNDMMEHGVSDIDACLLYTSPSPRDS